MPARAGTALFASLGRRLTDIAGRPAPHGVFSRKNGEGFRLN